MVRTRQQHQLASPGDLAVRRGEHLVQARACVELEIRDGRCLERRDQFQRPATRLLGVAHAQTLAAPCVRQRIEEAVIRLAAHRDSEEPRPRCGQAAAQGCLQPLAVDLAGSGQSVADVDHRGLLAAVQAGQGHVDEGAQIGRAPGRMRCQQLARLAHLSLGGSSQAGRRIQHLGPHVERHQSELVGIGERAQDGLGGRHFQLSRVLVDAGRGIHHNDHGARLLR